MSSSNPYQVFVTHLLRYVSIPQKRIFLFRWTQNTFELSHRFRWRKRLQSLDVGFGEEKQNELVEASHCR